MTENGNASIMMTRIGNREYPLVSVPNCHVCQNPNRQEIEEQIATGRPYRAIWRHLPPELQGTVSDRSMAQHFKNGHMPLSVATNRAMIEARAATVGKAIEDGMISLVDHMTLAQSVVDRVNERLVMGEIEPDVGDGLRAAHMLAQIEKDQGETVDLTAISDAFMVYMEVVRSVVTPEQLQAIGTGLRTNPVLRALEAKASIVDGEVVAEDEGQTVA